MRPPLLDRNLATVAAVAIAVIVYGSLYPFAFEPAKDGIGPVWTLLDSWAKPPGRGDFLSNILLYMPLGFSALLALGPGRARWRRGLAALLLGAALSIAMELTQYYDVGRDTEATDVYANVLGTLLGAIGGAALGGRLGSRLPGGAPVDPVPLLLLASWVGYRLFPYVPTIDLHKYWDALKPVVLHPSLAPYDHFRYTAMWLTVGGLVEGVLGHRRSMLLFPAFAAAVLLAKILIVNASLSLAEIVGAATALGLWLALQTSTRLRLLAICLLLGAYVAALRLEPFEFRAQAGSFRWIPFLSFMQGSIEVDVLSFLEKFFLYGSLVWFLSRAGLRLRAAALIVALLLFATSGAEVYLPGRSAEITDGVMALLIAGIFALIGTRPAAASFRAPPARALAPGLGRD